MINLVDDRSILIVDDSAVDRALLKKILSDSARLEVAENGTQALDMLQRLQMNVALVVLDIGLPDIDGYEVLRKIQDSPQLRGIPVLMVTSLDDIESQRKAFRLGALDVILKPLEAEIVRCRVHNILLIRQYEAGKWSDALTQAHEIDPKTGIWNKQTFFRETRRYMDAHPEESYVIAQWDIDRFKVFNDAYGADAGDALLATIGRRRREGMKLARAAGMIAYARLDGDHFASLWHASQVDAEALYWNTLEGLNAIIPNYNFSISYGFYRVENTAIDVSTMCDRALLALLTAKHNYQNQFAWYDESMRLKIVEEQELTALMRQALLKGEFIPYFQPQYDYATGELLGAEALVRWLSPTQGLISPSRFIPLFERNGFVYELDQAVWRQACRLLRKWLDKGLPISSVSINVSRRDMYGADLPDVLLHMIHEYALHPAMLRLEITESAYMENPEQLVRVVKTLQGHGFHVEMDDFGSGYSSLNMLKDVPVDMLKLDMKFVASDASNTRSGSILSSVVRMAHAIQLPVLAEGVETKEQADYLKSIGCTYMQGYYFSKPLSAQQMEQLLHTDGARAAKKEHEHFGVDGATDFLNASTQATLIFNSFVGGAGIAEYENGNLAALRLNDRFFEVLETTRKDYAPYQYHMLDRFVPESRKALLTALEHAIQTGQESHCELCGTRVGQPEVLLWTSCHFRCLTEKAGSYIFYFTLENITERKRLAGLNEIYGNIIRNLPVGVAVYELDGDSARPVYANDRVCRMFGINREEYDARIARQENINFVANKGLYPPDTMQRLYAGEIVEIPPLLAHRQDGSPFWLQTVAHCVLREQKPALCYTTLIDVTRQVETEQQVTIQREKLDAAQREALSLIKNTPSGTLRMKVTNGRVSTDYVSKSFCVLVGYSPAELTGSNIACDNSMVHPDDLTRLISAENETLKEGKDFHQQYRLRRKDGGYVWVSMRANYVGDVGNGYVYASYTDITDIKKLEQQLEHEKLEMANLINAIPGGVATYEVRPKRLNLLYASDGVAALSGRTPEEYRRLLNNDGSTSIYPLDEPTVLRALRKATRDGSELDITYRVLRLDGTLVWINLRGRTLGEHNGYPVFHAVYHSLSAATDLYNRIINETENILLVADRKTKEILFVNDAAAQLADATKDEAIGRTCYDYLKHYNAPCDYCVVDRLADQPLCQEIDFCGRHYFTRLTCIDWNGRDAFICYMSDRTEQHTSQQRIDAIIRNIPSGLAVYRVQQDQVKCIYLSDQAFEILGYEEDERTERNLGVSTRRLHPDDAIKLQADFAHIRGSIKQKQATGQEYIMDFRILMKKGGLRWVQLNAKTVVDEGVLFFYCIFTDITTQKAREEAEKTTISELNDAVENAPGGVCRWRLSEPFFLEFVSEGFCRMCGYSHEHLRQLTKYDVYALILPEDRQTVRAALMKLAQAPQILSVEYRYLHRDGSAHYALDTLRSVMGDNGVMCAYGQIFDITERRVAQENLRIREEEYRVGVEQSGKIIFRYILQNRRMDMPEQMEKQFGLHGPVINAPDAFLRAGLVDESSVTAWNDYFAAIDAGEHKGAVEVRVFCTDGKYHWFKGQFTGIRNSIGQPVSAILSYEDITQQRESVKEHALEYSGFYKAMRMVYPMTIAANLTQNTYYMLEYDEFYTKKAANKGVFDELIEIGASTVPSEDREAFVAAFSRQNLLASFTRGEEVVRLEHRQYGDDGVCRWMETVVMHVDNPCDDDVLEITVTRSIDEQKQTEAKLQEALEITSGKLAARLRYGAIINRVSSGLVVVRSISGASNKPPYLIGNLAQTLGYTADEMITAVQNGYAGLVHPDDAEILHSEIHRMVTEKPEEYELEYRIKKKTAVTRGFPHAANVLWMTMATWAM